MVTANRERTASPPAPRLAQRALRLELADPRCRDRRLVGPELAVFAAVAGRSRVPPTQVLTAPVELWWRPDADGSGPSPGLDALADGPVSIRSWLVRRDGAGAVVEPVWNNIDQAGLGEAIAELAAAARRRIPGSRRTTSRSTSPDAAGSAAPDTSRDSRDRDRDRRGGHRDGRGGYRLVFAVQRFVSAPASAVVQVEGRGRRVHVRLCWGLTESLGEPIYYDRFSFAGDPLQLERCKITDKYTATVAAAGGTRSARIAPGQVAGPVLPLVAVHGLATMCRGLIAGFDPGLELEFVLAGAEFVLLSARSCRVGTSPS